MSKVSGFTEAELMAAEWSKQNKAKKLAMGGVASRMINASRSNNDLSKSIYGPASYTNSSKDRSYPGKEEFSRNKSDNSSRDYYRAHSRDRLDRSKDDRKNDSSIKYEKDVRQNRDRSRSRSPNSGQNNSVDVDEFGRVRTKGSTSSTSHSSRGRDVNRSSRRSLSRSRSRSRSPLVRRRQYDDEKEDARRESEREERRRDRSKVDSEWRHDLFNRHDDRSATVCDLFTVQIYIDV